MEYNIPTYLTGLTDNELEEARSRHGYNVLTSEKEQSWLLVLLGMLKEPMLVLLIIISIVYIVVGDYADAIFMFFAIVAVSAISFYQDNRSRKALKELEKLTQPLSTVIRNSTVFSIPTQQIAVGDLCVVREGEVINADGQIVYSNDFSVNESSLTGESLSVYKNKDSADHSVFSGTIVVSGLAVFRVAHIGNETRWGKIGKSITNIEESSSPLKIQISRFVKWMAYIGIAIFLAVCLYSYLQTRNVVSSLLDGLTLAMSVLPEEIPVAFTTFMALGAWKLMKEGIIIKQSNKVETLGSTTVICADKTGTITRNLMQLIRMYEYRSGEVFDERHYSDNRLSELICYAMWSSEPVPYDPMEKELHKAYESTQHTDERVLYKMIHEYPLSGKPPMMTHLFENEAGNRIVAAKGAPGAILAVSALTENQKEEIRKQIRAFTQQGFRVLAVAKSDFKGNEFPKSQQELPFEFLGLVVFNDPPKQGIKSVFKKIYQAGIKVKVITGDNAETTVAISDLAGIAHESATVSGEDILSCTEDQLISLSEKTTLFTRMFPEAKLAVVNALKKQKEIVVMLGDGVNDAPALKAAHIGVAMGNKGTEIAKAAADLIITNDDLEKLITGIAAGRRIYSNLKKAIQYIISIHIPIILTVSLPLFLGWLYPLIFTPVHVIFLELVMGPTCSIVYENEPIEKHAMLRPPRAISDTFLNLKELTLSIIQGLAITVGVLYAYQLSVQSGGNEEKTRAMVFTTLIFANLILTFSNRSFYTSIIENFRKKNRLLWLIVAVTGAALFVILYWVPATRFFKVCPLTGYELITTLTIALGSILWFEIYKGYRRLRA